MSKSDIQNHKAAKLFKPSGPHQLWQTYITYIHCGVDGWCYCFNVLDAFTRKWLSYGFEVSATAKAAVAAVVHAVVQEKPDATKLRIRTDNGSQYSSREFRESIKSLGIRHDFIWKNTPEQNGHIESFHKTLKKEYVWPKDFARVPGCRSACPRICRLQQQQNPFGPGVSDAKRVYPQIGEQERKMSGQSVHKSTPKTVLKTGVHSKVHAEMDALVGSARRGESVKDCVMYCTTFPCHICAKHIVASGIKSLVFIEPYPKSHAAELFSDSISVEDSKQRQGSLQAVLWNIAQALYGHVQDGQAQRQCDRQNDQMGFLPDQRSDSGNPRTSLRGR